MLFVTAVIWGMAFVAQSEGMNYVGPFTYNGIRTILGGIVLIPFILLFKRKPGKINSLNNEDKNNKTDKTDKTDKNIIQPAPIKTTVLGGLCCGVIFFVAGSLQQYGLKYTTAGKAGFITALYIVIVPILEFIIYKKASFKIFICTLVAVIGFYMLCIREDFSISGGDLLVLACAFFFAVHIMVIDRFNAKNVDGTIMSCIQFFVGGTMMLICMFIFEEPDLDSVTAAWLPICYGGILSCGVAYTLQILGQRDTDPTVATLILSLESVFAAVSAWFILGETMDFKEICGCLLVFTAVIVAQTDLAAFKAKKDKNQNKEYSE